jgi:two-component system, NarL family, response regulator DesR
VVDDHPAVVAAISDVVAAAPDLTFVDGARTTADGIALASRVDVLVCDMNLAGGAEGLQVLRSIHDPRIARVDVPPLVLFLSGYGYPSLIRAAIDGGAAGFLDKGAELREIVDAIRSVARGGTAYSQRVLSASRDARRRPSDREIQVIEGIVRGATNAEIAAVLGLSEKTVESHLRRLFDRYELLSRTELAVLAIDEGWTTKDRSLR